MLRIPKKSILSETVSDIVNRTGLPVQNYRVRKHVERIEVTTFIHEQVGDPEKENFDQVAIHRSEKGSIRRAFTFNT